MQYQYLKYGPRVHIFPAVLPECPPELSCESKRQGHLHLTRLVAPDYSNLGSSFLPFMSFRCCPFEESRPLVLGGGATPCSASLWFPHLGDVRQDHMVMWCHQLMHLRYLAFSSPLWLPPTVVTWVTLNVALLCWRNEWKVLGRCPQDPGCRVSLPELNTLLFLTLRSFP